MKNIGSSLKGRYFACQLNLFIPWEEPYFFEIITVDQKTASNIPVERHCLGYGLNHQNIQDVTNSIEESAKWKMKTFNNTLFLVYIGYTPKQ